MVKLIAEYAELQSVRLDSLAHEAIRISIDLF